MLKLDTGAIRMIWNRDGLLDAIALGLDDLTRRCIDELLDCPPALAKPRQPVASATLATG